VEFILAPGSTGLAAKSCSPTRTVEEMMGKRSKLLTSLAVAAVCLAAAPAVGQYAAYPDGREPAYFTTLYSDSSHTTVVGHITPECGYAYVQYTLDGTYSIYGVDELVGYCTQYGWEQL
jgi:hypothetical protein